MCHFCDEAVRLIEQTTGTNSWVEFSFPGGKPRLVANEANEEEIPSKGIPDTVD